MRLTVVRIAAGRKRLCNYGWWFALLLLIPLARGADQFIELTAEIEMNDWDACFFFDGQGRWPAREAAPSLFTVNHTRHCVVGTNTWMVAATSERGRSTYWFTGTNVISNFLVARQPPQGERKGLSRPGFPAATSLPTGEHFTVIAESSDGNPGRPGGVADLMSFDVPSRICWLAFCSGPALNRAGRKLYPPSDLWKESGIYYYGWADQTSVFSDDLKLPRQHLQMPRRQFRQRAPA